MHGMEAGVGPCTPRQWEWSGTPTDTCTGQPVAGAPVLWRDPSASWGKGEGSSPSEIQARPQGARGPGL